MIQEESLKSLTVTLRGGGKLISHRPVFSQDGSSLYIIQSSLILAYSTSTCSLITRFVTPGSTPIANVQPQSSSKLLVLTTAGQLLSLDIHTGVFQLELKIRIPSSWTPMSNFIDFLHPIESNPHEHFLALGYPQDASFPVLYSVSVSTRSPTQLCWAIVPNHHSFDMSKEGRFIAAIQETSLFCKDMEDPLNCKWHSSGTRKFTCLAIHPTEPFVCATGDDSGRVLIWNNVMTQKSPAKTVFHWHTLPVVDLIFTVEGSQMFSGGGECTLVKWDCSDTTNKRTLPRMGLPIRHLSCNDELVAVSHADNCVQLVDQYNKIVGVIKNFTNAYVPEEMQGGEKSEVFPAGITVDPSNNCLVMNGRPGWLQAYNFKHDKHVYSLDVCQQNYVTAEREKTIPNADVIKVTFSKTGLWMGTVEGRQQEGSYSELKLKFWKRNKTSGTFLLNTVVDWPHEGNVLALEFRLVGEQGGDLILLSSGDKRVKVWGLAERATVHGDSEFWYLENVLEYKDLHSGPISFSSDCSLVAAGFERIVTLWDGEDLKLRLSLCHARLNEQINRMEFGNRMNSHLLLCSSAKSLFVWDCITASLLWVLPVKVHSFAVCPYSGLCAAATADLSLVFFNMNDSEPLAVHQRVTKSGIVACKWIEDKGEDLRSSLVFLNSSQELCAMRGNVEEEEEIVKVGKDVHMTVYSEMLAEKVTSGVKSGKGLGQRNVGQKAYALLREIMDSSPHTMPSMSYYCTELMKAVGSPVNEMERLEQMERMVKKGGKKKNRSSKTEFVSNENSTKKGDREKDIKQTKGLESMLSNLNLDNVIEDNCSWIENIFKKDD